ncbi:MAG TPA: hypothetical protein PKG95_08935, partial [Anaerolineaceae bacterium]|nr:hypothetical protein [Anaerolineaceae bacterium]
SGLPGDAGDNINAMIRSWKDILGAEITIEYVDPDNYTEELRKNPGHIVSYGWCADYPDPENFLDLLFHSASEFNPTGYNNPEVDALLEQARSEPDPAVRIELYQQAERLIIEDGAVLPMFHSRMNQLVSPRVQGYTISPMGTSYVFDIALVGDN